MKHLNILTTNLDLDISNKYLEITVKILEPKILKEKVEVLIDYFILKNKILTFSSNIIGSRVYMMTSKYSFDRAKSRL